MNALLAVSLMLLPAADEPSIVWKYESAIGISAPLVLKDLVIFGDDKGTMKALSAETGEERWKSSVGNRVYYTPQTDGEYIAVEMERAGVAVLKASTGELLWKNPLPKGAGCCHVHKERKCVYVAGLDGQVYCFDSASGTEKWHSDVLKEAPKVPKTVNGAQARLDEYDARPRGFACDGERLYLTIVDQMRVVVLDLDEGFERGHFLTGGWIWTEPAIADSAFLMSSDDGNFYCVDAATREKRWVAELGSGSNATPLVVDEDVYVGTDSRGLRCLDLRTGREKWKFEFTPEAKRTKAVYASPVLHRDEVVFASMEGRLFGIRRKDGEKSWEYRAFHDLEIAHPLVEREDVAFVVFQAPWDPKTRNSRYVLGALKLP